MTDEELYLYFEKNYNIIAQDIEVRFHNKTNSYHEELSFEFEINGESYSSTYIQKGWIREYRFGYLGEDPLDTQPLSEVYKQISRIVKINKLLT